MSFFCTAEGLEKKLRKLELKFKQLAVEIRQLELKNDKDIKTLYLLQTQKEVLTKNSRKQAQINLRLKKEKLKSYVGATKKN